MTAYQPSWRDRLAAHVCDLGLALGTSRFRQIVRDAVQAAVIDAMSDRAEAPALNPDFFTAENAASQEQS